MLSLSEDPKGRSRSATTGGCGSALGRHGVWKFLPLALQRVRRSKAALETCILEWSEYFLKGDWLRPGRSAFNSETELSLVCKFQFFPTMGSNRAAHAERQNSCLLCLSESLCKYCLYPCWVYYTQVLPPLLTSLCIMREARRGGPLLCVQSVFVEQISCAEPDSMVPALSRWLAFGLEGRAASFLCGPSFVTVVHRTGWPLGGPFCVGQCMYSVTWEDAELKLQFPVPFLCAPSSPAPTAFWLLPAPLC